MKKLILAIFLLFETLNLYAENGLNGEYYSGNDCPTTSLSNKRLAPNIDFTWTGNPPISGRAKNWSARFSGYLYVPQDKNSIFFEICNSAEAKRQWSRVVLNSNQKECREDQPQGANKTTQVSHGLHKIEAYYNAGNLPNADRCMKLHWGDNKNGEIVGKEYFFPSKVAVIEFDKKEYKFDKKNGKQKIKVNLLEPLRQDLEIKIEAYGGTATNGADYELETYSITIPKGKNSAEVAIKILDNASWTNNIKNFFIKLAPTSGSNFTTTSNEKVSVVTAPEFGETMIKINGFDNDCALLPDDVLKPDIVYESYQWRKMLTKTNFENKLAGDDVVEKRHFKLQNNDFNKKRISLIKNQKNVDGKKEISGFTNKKPLPFKDKIFEVAFDYYSYGGTEGGMALILYDGSQEFPVLSDLAEGLGYAGGVKNRGTNPFTTVPKIIGDDFTTQERINGELLVNCQNTSYDPPNCYKITPFGQRKSGGWLAIGFDQIGEFTRDPNKNIGSAYDIKYKGNAITIRSSIQDPYEADRKSRKENAYWLTTITDLKGYNLETDTNKKLVGRFKIKIDNTQSEKSLLTISRQIVNESSGTILGKEDVLLKDFDLMAKINPETNRPYQKPAPEKIKIAFSAASQTYSGTRNAQEIGNIVACPYKIDNEDKFRVVERVFAKFYNNPKNKDKTINGIKYDFNWLWNSPLRTKIAGSAPLSHTSEKIGYEYCVFSKDGSYSSKFKIAYSKLNGKTFLEKYRKEYEKQGNAKKLSVNKNDLEENFLTSSDAYGIDKDGNLVKDSTGYYCFVLNKDFTSKNITPYMHFGVYQAGKNLDGRKSSDAFAIRPAGFGLEFQEADFNASGELEPLKNGDIIKATFPKLIISSTSDPLRDINSSISLKADSIYLANIATRVLNITGKKPNLYSPTGSSYNYRIVPDPSKNYYNFFDTKKDNLIAQTNGKICADDKNISLGKIKKGDENSSRFVFQGGKLIYDNDKFGVNETLQKKDKSGTIENSPDLYITYNNVMEFMVDVNDTIWTIVDQQQTLDQVKKYGRECKGIDTKEITPNRNFDKDDFWKKTDDKGKVISKFSSGEVVYCATEFLFPRYIKFIPPKVAVNFSNIINQSKFGDKKDAKGGFTYINDLIEINSQKDMSAKVQMIIHPTSDDNKNFSNFTNKCYADDINLTIDYIGDKNLIFDKNRTLLDKNLADEIDKNFENKDEFTKYINDKKKFTHNQDELNKPTDKIDATKTHTGNIAFELNGFYEQDKLYAKFCPNDKNGSYLCKDINISNDKDEGYDYVSKVFKRKNIIIGYDSDKKENTLVAWEFKNPVNLSINIPKNFFNENMKYYDKDFNINKLDLGKTALMLGVNFTRSDKDRQNPIALFERDFMATNAKISNTDISATNIYPKHDTAKAGMFFYGYTKALDAEGSAEGFNHDVSYVVYCDNTTRLDCKNDIEFLRKKDTFPQTSNVFVNSEHNIKKSKSKIGIVDRYTPIYSIAKNPIEIKIHAENGKDKILLEAKDKKNLPKTDTIEMEVPPFLKFSPTFKVTFLGEGGKWFGHGGVINDSGIYQQGEGRVLDTDDGKFKAPMKPKRKIEW